MSKQRRSAEEIRAAILRIESDDLKPLEELSDGLRVSIAGLPAHVSALTLQRWATEGRLRSDKVRVWLDAICRRGCWVSSSEAVARFLGELAAVEAG